MSTKTQNITVKKGTYTNKAGETKADWMHIGRLVTHEDGKQSIYLDAIPTNFDGKAYVFAREQYQPELKEVS